jgi:LETM1 and EF-hand domain-containing protein 1
MPLLLKGGGFRAARLRSTALPREVSAIALLVPRRHLSTETSTSGAGSPSTFPPPGFNAEEAKKPLHRDSRSKAADSSEQPVKASDVSRSDVKIPRNEPTTHPKTNAVSSQSLTELAAKKAAAAESKAQSKDVEKKKEEQKKLTLMQKIKREVAHYWDGTKLLATEVKISSKLALRMAAGYELTRREHRQVCVSLTMEY